MKELKQQYLTGERALFFGRDLKIYDTTFADGESPLKESKNIELYGCMFKWKYPLWYSRNIKVKDSTLFENARAGIWYTEDISLENSTIAAPKTFRRCKNLKIENVTIPHAGETLWACKGVTIKNAEVCGDYFGMNCSDVECENLSLLGNYGFDGVENLTVRNSRLLTKDAFWNCKHVRVENSFISGEYLGWNSKDLVFVNCVIESLQGLCYIDNLKLINCKLLNTTLAFEYSTVEADVDGKIDSVLNPNGGRICADEIDELIIERDKVDPEKTVIICRAHENKNV